MSGGVALSPFCDEMECEIEMKKRYDRILEGDGPLLGLKSLVEE